MLTTVISLLAAVVVLFRCICVAAALNLRDWGGHPVRFAAIAIGHTSMAAGALSMVLGKQYGGFMLLVGIATLIMFDRRKSMR